MAGEVCHYAGASVPVGWLKANGAAVSRSTYAALFAALGTQFGAGDGVNTFNLPDLRGEFLRALDDGRSVDAGRALGSAQGDAIRNITGNVGYLDGGASGAFAGGAQTGILAGGSTLRYATSFDASRVVPTANENRPRNVALLALIKY
ncbi:tail fiber protein [Neisseriaceae bacterium JH1-16]|nr:tail fiber protein [Neisseriaceae bacterium JH1-16]